jgi:glycosyltransferase involved in cell wall biosynthesis
MDEFARVGGSHDFILFVTSGNRGMFEKYESYSNFRFVEVNQTSHAFFRRCYNRLPIKLRYRLPCDLLNWYFSKSYAEIVTREADVHFVPLCPPQLFPFPANPTVYAIYDLQHVHFPEFFTAEQRLERRVNFAQCVRKASLIQASCRHMRKDFLEHLEGLEPEKVVIIPEGVDIDFFQIPRSSVEIKARYNLPDTFLFLPAQLWHHKNHITLLRALKRLREREIEIPLVMTGHRYDTSQGIFDFIEANGLNRQIFYLGVVPFEDVAALYQSARFLVMPSLSESSSIPILEAAAAGTGIIASRIPPNEEVADDLVLRLFEPADDGELADLLASMWDTDTRDAIELNRKNVQRYSWKSIARRYLEVFELLGSGQSSKLRSSACLR